MSISSKQPTVSYPAPVRDPARNEERYALAMQSINYAVYDADLEGGEVYFSESLRELLGMKPVVLAHGRAVFAATPDESHYNPIGVVHGGLAATLLDSAMGCAVQSTLPVGSGYTTLELKVNFVKTLTDKVPLVRAVSEVIYNGAKIGTSQGKLIGPDGTLFAHATTTCIVLDAR